MAFSRSTHILKNSSSSLKASSLETDLLDKPRFPATAPIPPTSEAPSSSPILKSSPATVTVDRPFSMTTMSDECIPIPTNKPGPRKRQFQYTLLPDGGIEDYKDFEDFPAKRCKTLLTSFTCKRTPEASVYFTQRMLELSRISRRVFAAQKKYQRLRTEELRLITSIMEDEAEESKARLNGVDLQIGTLRNDLFDAGVAPIGNKGSDHGKEAGFGRGFPQCGHHEANDTSDSCSSSDDSSVYGESEHADSPHI